MFGPERWFRPDQLAFIHGTRLVAGMAKSSTSRMVTLLCYQGERDALPAPMSAYALAIMHTTGTVHDGYALRYVPPRPTAMSARSRCGVVPPRRCDMYLAICMRTPAMSLAHWPRPRLSSNRVAAASALRCCLPISNAFCGLVGFGCAAHAVLKMSSRSRPLHRTFAALQNWSLDRHQQPLHVLRSQ